MSIKVWGEIHPTLARSICLAAIGLGVVAKTYHYLNRFDFRNKVVLVTGASQGIGEAVAKEVARLGARKVFLVARSLSKLETLSEEINQKFGPVAVPLEFDVTDGARLESLREKVITHLSETPFSRSTKITDGTVPDVIVHCAGAGTWRFLHENTYQEIQDYLSVPYLGAAFVTRLFLPDMIEVNKGHIVFVQSPAAYLPWGGATGYAVSRVAMRGLFEALQIDLSSTKIQVHEVICGEVSDSQYFISNPGSRERFPSIAKIIPSITSERAARTVCYAVQNNQARTSTPFMISFLMAFFNRYPSLVRWVVQKTSWTVVPFSANLTNA